MAGLTTASAAVIRSQSNTKLNVGLTQFLFLWAFHNIKRFVNISRWGFWPQHSVFFSCKEVGTFCTRISTLDRI